MLINSQSLVSPYKSFPQISGPRRFRVNALNLLLSRALDSDARPSEISAGAKEMNKLGIGAVDSTPKNLPNILKKS
jgi:hypothetical protein